MTPTQRTLDRLESNLGELVAAHEDAADLDAFEQYADDPVGFQREVLNAEPWEAQREIATAVLDRPKVVVRSCNGAGKDFEGAQLALWWALARQGLVLISGPTERQVREVVMGEVARAFRQATDLPGELYTTALRLGRGEKRGILAFTSSEASQLTGFHAPRVMVILTEAQAVEAWAWEGLLSCSTGTADRFLALGNPLSPDGEFFEKSNSEEWHDLRISAADHPNVRTGEQVIPGAVSPAFIRSMKAEYGEESPVYRARVEGEFPDAGEHTLIARSWLDAAEEAWEELDTEEPLEQETAWAALDPAGAGPDVSAMVLADGWNVQEILTWSAPSTMETTGRAVHELKERDLDPRSTPIVVDSTGIGDGVASRLEELRAGVLRFESATQATDPDRFLNRRAEAWWRLREALEEERISLPPDRQLRRDLTSVRWWVNSSGRIQIESKRDLRSRIGRSPDRGDAVAYLVWWLVEGGRQPQTGIAWASPGAGELFGLGQDPRRVVDEDRRDGWRPVDL